MPFASAGWTDMTSVKVVWQSSHEVLKGRAAQDLPRGRTTMGSNSAGSIFATLLTDSFHQIVKDAQSIFGDCLRA